MVEDVSQPTSGMITLMYSLTAEYQINTRFIIKAFINSTHNTPKVSTTFPNSNTMGGFSLRFTLAK